MPDRVKEAVFSILGSYYDCPGVIPSIRVADVFAGSGSMGLEALSRGASMCCFFERDPRALDALKKNLEVLHAGDWATIVTRDAWTGALSGPDGQVFDLILLDPPYADSDDTSEGGFVRRYLARLSELEDNKPLVVLHHRAKICYPCKADDAWRIWDQRTFGSNATTIFIR